MSMKLKRLWLISGLPGSGKSTWLRKQMFKEPHSVYVSRDEVRFSMLNDNDEYFAKENEVFNTFIHKAEGLLQEPYIYDVYMDATHLNPKARRKTLNAFTNLNNISINSVYFDVPIETCIERNNQRTGRALVPVDVIYSMNRTYYIPTFKEDFDIIKRIDKDGNEKVSFRNE